MGKVLHKSTGFSTESSPVSEPSKTWVTITGSSSGIGKACAQHLAAQGFPVVLASEQAQQLREVRDEIVDRGGVAEVVDLDLLDKEQVASFHRRVEERVGFSGILVNNAGIGVHKPFEDISDEDFRRVFEVNFFALVRLSRDFYASMKERRDGHVVNISSASARRSIANMSCYGASKGAVHCFSQALRQEALEHGVAVTEILPISVRTEFFQKAGYQPKGLVQGPERIAKLLERAIRTREAEICSSQLTRLGFLLDLLAPSAATKLIRRFKRFG